MTKKVSAEIRAGLNDLMPRLWRYGLVEEAEDAFLKALSFLETTKMEETLQACETLRNMGELYEELFGGAGGIDPSMMEGMGAGARRPRRSALRRGSRGAGGGMSPLGMMGEDCGAPRPPAAWPLSENQRARLGAFMRENGLGRRPGTS